MKYLKYGVVYILSLIPLFLSFTGVIAAPAGYENIPYLVAFLVPPLFHVVLFYKKENRTNKEEIKNATRTFFVVLVLVTIGFGFYSTPLINITNSFLVSLLGILFTCISFFIYNGIPFLILFWITNKIMVFSVRQKEE